MIHAVYTSIESKRTYVLYYPGSRTHTLHLIHNLKKNIANVFTPEASQYYIPDEIMVPGLPKVDSQIQSYARTLIHLKWANPQEQPLPQIPPFSNKSHHTGQPKTEDPETILQITLGSTFTHDTAMTAAVHDTTSRLKALEDKNSNTCKFLDILTTLLEYHHQFLTNKKMIYQPWGIHSKPKKIIYALQQTQIQQSFTMEKMGTV